MQNLSVEINRIAGTRECGAGTIVAGLSPGEWHESGQTIARRDGLRLGRREEVAVMHAG
jgi:hypothetical protein